MLNKTRCAITPFTSSGKAISSEVMTKILAQWSEMACALEEAMNLQDEEVLVWCLMLTGGQDKTESLSQTEARAHAQVELCRPGHLPHGCYALHSATSTYQGTLVTLAMAETNILESGLSTKGVGAITLEESVSSFVRELRQVR